ncbi:MAG TPA: hypothetical protein IGS53_06295 [Leptolyngbyaceae cyanobacterium M33_DOE_097]|uniref:Sigma-70 family RNA polymerase sigma factor n=1 Tax=Oscillatoriales cyanobacterium SpSt-418 TaxID=2282169 RepID=A0A7C3PUR7_9CYAN|nr:hypothetical protein [Leptolyngbyaceae cyanobacterium M33_DOE_097]
MDQDEHLHQLIAEVSQHFEGTREWRKAMNRLLIVIQSFPEFKKYTQLNCPDYCLDALNQTWEWFSRNIQNFEPRSSSVRSDLVRWLKGYLYWRIRDLAANSGSGKPGELSLDEAIADLDNIETTWLDRVSNQGEFLGTTANPRVLSGLETYVEQLQAQSDQQIVANLADYIEQDPERKLRDCYPRKHPECNCQTLAQRLLFVFKNPPDKLTDIARECQINYQTLVSHWKLKGLPLLQHIATDLGYHPQEQP